MTTGVIVYQDVDFKGASAELGPGIHEGKSSYTKDKNPSIFFKKSGSFKTKDISSLKVRRGYGCVCYDASGKSLVFSNPSNNNSGKTYLEIRNLVNWGFNDVITKIVVFRTTQQVKIDQNGAFKEGFNFGFGCGQWGHTDFLCIINVLLSIFCLIVAIWFMYERLSGKIQVKMDGGGRFNYRHW